jgi:core-2/I-Branching enzyme
VKIAALILAWKFPEGVSALRSYFEQVDIDVFVHVDRKVDIAPFLEVTGPAPGKVRFLENPGYVFYGGFTLVEAIVKLIQAARLCHSYDRYVIISDDSLPLFPPSETANRLGESENHIDGGPSEEMRRLRYDGFAMPDSAATQLRWIDYQERILDEQALARIGRLIALKARGKASFGEYYKGSTWMALSSRSVDVIMTSWDKDILLKESFEFSLFPDEAYFHTILGNHRLLSSRRLVHDDWSVQSPPRVFRTFEELLAIIPDDALFVRKVVLDAADMERWMRHIRVI